MPAAKQKNAAKGVFLFGRGSKIRTYGMTESESVALPLGDTPLRFAGVFDLWAFAAKLAHGSTVPRFDWQG